MIIVFLDLTLNMDTTNNATLAGAKKRKPQKTIKVTQQQQLQVQIFGF